MINFLPKERTPRATLYGGLLTLAPRMLSFLKSEFQITPIPCRGCFCRTLQNLVIIITFFLYTLGFPHSPWQPSIFSCHGLQSSFFPKNPEGTGCGEGPGFHTSRRHVRHSINLSSWRVKLRSIEFQQHTQDHLYGFRQFVSCQSLLPQASFSSNCGAIL